jgi:hypothetical protein
MKVIFRFWAKAEPGKKPGYITDFTRDFDTIGEARDEAFRKARTPQMTANEFTIEEDQGKVLEHLIFSGSSWEKPDAQGS